MQDPISPPLFSVVIQNRSFYVVVSRDKYGDAQIVPITLKRLPMRRTDVQVCSDHDADKMALKRGTYLIHTEAWETLIEGVVVGHCPPAIKDEIIRTIRRSGESRELESKYRASSMVTDALRPIRPHADTTRER